jgi:hypothetical protein
MDTAPNTIAVQATASAINLVFLMKTPVAVRFPSVLVIPSLALILQRKTAFLETTKILLSILQNSAVSRLSFSTHCALDRPALRSLERRMAKGTVRLSPHYSPPVHHVHLRLAFSAT